ncbi:MAG: AAA family ATPase [Enhygromyxa sp.]
MARFIESITLTNFLSFGPESTTLQFEDINVLVGANGSGKSNLIEAINVLRHAPTDLARVLREGGGAGQWLWKDEKGQTAERAEIEIVLAPDVITGPSTRYRLSFGIDGNQMVILDERIENAEPTKDRAKPYFYFGYENGAPMMNLAGGGKRQLRREHIDSGKSILAQRRDPESYPELTRLGDCLAKIRAYCNWHTGPKSSVRESCRADVPSDLLEEDLSNLPARIQRLKGEPPIKRRLLELLRKVSPGFDDIEIMPEGGTLQMYLFEGDRKIASQRVSDGTLRYLMLIAILLDPAPPPLLVIEEPEICLHADMYPTLRRLMLEAGEHMQIIITTQSPTFLDAWTDHPSFVVVCEREDGVTTLERLESDDLDNSEGLGVRWTRGEIGGTRW